MPFNQKSRALMLKRLFIPIVPFAFLAILFFYPLASITLRGLAPLADNRKQKLKAREIRGTPSDTETRSCPP